MKRKIETSDAPSAIGPYSQAIEINGMLFISGQIPVNPANSQIVDGGIRKQTLQVMHNIGAILKSSGYDFHHIAKCTCLLKNMEDFQVMNEVYGSFFPENPPARAAFEVARLPRDVLIEIEAIAIK